MSRPNQMNGHRRGNPAVTVRFAEPTWSQLNDAAERQGVSLAEFVRELVVSHFEGRAPSSGPDEHFDTERVLQELDRHREDLGQVFSVLLGGVFVDAKDREQATAVLNETLRRR